MNEPKFSEEKLSTRDVSVLENGECKFDYHRPIWIKLWINAYIGISIYAFVISVRHSDVKGIFISIFLVWTLITASIYAAAGASSVCINFQGISRKWFGKTWSKLSWNNVEYIYLREYTNTLNKKIKQINILPIKKSGFTLYPSGKMAFNDLTKNPRELFDVLNKYIALHQIKLEQDVNGVRQPIVKL